jgi:hypothetical protein
MEPPASDHGIINMGCRPPLQGAIVAASENQRSRREGRTKGADNLNWIKQTLQLGIGKELHRRNTRR